MKGVSGIIPFRLESVWNGDALDLASDAGDDGTHTNDAKHDACRIANWMLDRTPVRAPWSASGPVRSMIQASHARSPGILAAVFWLRNATVSDECRSRVARVILPYMKFSKLLQREFFSGQAGYVRFETLPGTRLKCEAEKRLVSDLADVIGSMIARTAARYEAGSNDGPAAGADAVVEFPDSWFYFKRELNADFMPAKTARALGIRRGA